MRSFLAVVVLLVVSSLAFAQGPVVLRTVNSGDAEGVVSQIFASPDMGSSLSFFGRHMPSDPLGMLQREQIQDELDLNEDQIAVIKELQSDIQRQTKEIFSSGAKFGGDAARMMATAQKAIRQNIEKELKSVLSPKQLKRLGQLEVQMSLRNRGVRALTEEKLAAALEISDEQKKEIREGQRESQKALQKEIEALRERHRNRLLQRLLSDEQLSKLELLSGNEYKVKTVNRRRVLGD